jgi:type IV secretion system protein VirB8
MNKPAVSKKEFEQYLNETRSWETDKVKAMNKSLRVAHWYGGAATVVAIMASIASVTMAFAWMNPAPPPVIRVDNATGIVDVVESIRNGKTNYEENINKYFIQWYVRYREGYSRDLAEEYYTNVGIMSVGLEQQKYFEYFNPKNPTSPLNVYGPYAKVKIGIKGTSFIKPNVALVRYTKSIERGLDKPQITHWAATITFRYSGAPMKQANRNINPLGFQATEYRNDPDAVTQDATEIEKPADQPHAPANAPVVFGGQAAPTAPPAQPPTAAAMPITPVAQAAPVVPAIE